MPHQASSEHRESAKSTTERLGGSGFQDGWVFYLGISENRGPKYRTLNSRILIIRTPK